LTWIELAFTFAAGAVVGSFLNVCIWRLPTDRSLIWPGSHCPKCLRFIRWYENIPLISYLVLRGRCRRCRARISIRYPIVELITALSFVGLYWLEIVAANGSDDKYWVLAVHCYVVAALIASSLIDLEHQILPDEITWMGLLVGLTASALLPELHDAIHRRLVGLAWVDGLAWSAFGALVGSGLTGGMAVLGRWVFRRDAMGLGDVKLMAMLGAFFGWDGALLVFFIAPFFGLVIGGFIALKRRTRAIPYGPFLSMAAVVVLLFKAQILRYLQGLGRWQ